LQKQWNLAEFTRQILPKERVSRCMTTLKNGHSKVNVHRHIPTNKHYFQNLIRCSNVWCCVHCSPRISARRGEELKKIMQLHHDNNGKFYMATFTLRHNVKSDLKQMLNVLSHAYHATMNKRFGKDLKAKYQIVGYVRSLEVTYGLHGFHPHYHVLIFTKEHIPISQFTDDVSTQWLYQLDKMGFASNFHAFDLKQGNNKQLAEYLNKISLAYEMTGTQNKIVGGLNWYQILEKAQFEKKYLDLFLEYVFSFKTKKQLVYSRDLIKEYRIKIKTDEQLNDEKHKDAEFINQLTLQEYQFLRRTKTVPQFLYLCYVQDFHIAYDQLQKKMNALESAQI
jgi:hypothetical protein